MSNSIAMDVFPHFTQLKERRICIKFDERPSDALLRVLKMHGSHRPIGNGKRAWQFNCELWRVLGRDLNMQGYEDVAQRVIRTAKAWNATPRQTQKEGTEQVQGRRSRATIWFG